MSFRKKLAAVTAAAMLSALLGGCKLRSSVDENARNTGNHEFDIADYINISDFGENGDGYVKVTEKDFDADDFKSDADYIAVKKTLDQMNLNCIAGPSEESNSSSSVAIKMTDNTHISNGDKAVISFSKPDKKYADMCFDKIVYTVSNLKSLNQIDFFSPQNVVVFALPTGDLKTCVKGNAMDRELRDAISYSASYEDPDEKIEQGKSVVDVQASLSDDFRNANPQYPDLKEYLAEHGQKAKTSKSFVLKNLISTVNWDTVDRDELKALLTNVIESAMRNAQRYNSENKDDVFASDAQPDSTTTATLAYVTTDLYDYSDTGRTYEAEVTYAHFADDGTTVYATSSMNIGQTADGLVAYDVNLGSDMDELPQSVDTDKRIVANFLAEAAQQAASGDTGADAGTDAAQ